MVRRGSNQCGSHPRKLGVWAGSQYNGTVRGADRLRQNIDASVSCSAFDGIHHRLDAKARRKVAGCLSTHAVRDNQKALQRADPVIRRVDKVLIIIPF